MPAIIPVTVLVRDLEALRAVCRRRSWEFRAGQRCYRWFGRRLDDRPLPRDLADVELGRCVHAIGVPGCLYEIGLVRRGDHFRAVWDEGPEGGLDAALGPGGGRFWQAYIAEVVRRAGHRHGQRISRYRDALGTLRLRLLASREGPVAHVRVARDGTTALWLFDSAAMPFRYLVDVLGTARPDEITILDADPTGTSSLQEIAHGPPAC